MSRGSGVFITLVVTVAGGVAAMLVYDQIKKRGQTQARTDTAVPNTGGAYPPQSQWPKTDMFIGGSQWFNERGVVNL